MKKILTISMALIATASVAQVTIDANSFPRLASFADSISKTEQTGIALPTEGAAQVWDYSSLVSESIIIDEHFDATADPNFPNALNSYENNLTFQGFLIPSNSYEAIDVDGWYEMGRSTSEVGYSITSISGGANDSLVFLGGNSLYDGRINSLKFPLTYQSQWTESHIEYSNFNLSVAAFSLNHVPGNQKRILTNERNVVGYGQLTIPREDGTPSAEMDVLLMKVVRSAIDSFFLGGAEAPAPLLAAFGLTQGGFASDSFYVFYKPDFEAPVLNINFSSTGQAINAFYRTSATEAPVSVNTPTVSGFTCYPNPAGAGRSLLVQTSNTNKNPREISLLDMQGRVVFNQSVSNQAGNSIQLDLPINLSSGIYMLRVQDLDGMILGTNKLQITE